MRNLHLGKKAPFERDRHAVVGLFTGFFLYLNPEKMGILPAIHGSNNLIILILSLLQLITGIEMYFGHMLAH